VGVENLLEKVHYLKDEMSSPHRMISGTHLDPAHRAECALEDGDLRSHSHEQANIEHRSRWSRRGLGGVSRAFSLRVLVHAAVLRKPRWRGYTPAFATSRCDRTTTGKG
jgi:hypothetical protein